MREKTGLEFWECMSEDELFNIVNNYPTFYIKDDTTLSDIENLNEGNYIINRFPSINLLKQFPKFMNNCGEIMILMINDKLVMNISKNEYSYYAGELIPILKKGDSILLNVHSHPIEDVKINVGVPSMNDLKNGNSFNKLVYIIHDKGVLEYDISSINHIDKEIIDISFWKYICSNPEYKKMNIYDQENLYCDYIGLKRRQLTFEEFYSIYNRIKEEKFIHTSEIRKI